MNVAGTSLVTTRVASTAIPGNSTYAALVSIVFPSSVTSVSTVAGAAFSLIFSQMILSGGAFGKTVAGPSMTFEQTAPAEIQSGEDGDAAAGIEGKELSKRRLSMDFLVPIPVNFLGGMLVGRGKLAQEQREFIDNSKTSNVNNGHRLQNSGSHSHFDLVTQGSSGTQQDEKIGNTIGNDHKNPNMLALGAVYLPHAKEGAPRFFAAASRYGDANFAASVRPMSEYILGADIDVDDMPIKLKWNTTDEAETRLLVRYRQYPGFAKWLLYAGHSITTAGGWIFQAHIPSHLRIGWQTPDQRKVYYGELRAESRNYPVTLGGKRGWQTGYVGQIGLGIRQAVLGPLFLGLLVGAQNESLTFIDESGETRESHRTAFAPWGRLSVETWFDTTKPR